ncbi:ABC transporter permease [Halorussus litoreus]|uniref:ABC transporter permease n=1 Tax=Halorussus litoreus TaxID=1710536 RepID=UPI000E2579B7|nr:ABC transporter permease [Halorussus litoreus]
MSRKRYVAYRLAWTAVGAWAVLTLIFIVFDLVPDPGQYNIFNGMSAEQYREMRGYDQPLLQRYLSWMVGFLTLDLGTTIYGNSVSAELASAAKVTLTYAVPSVVLGVTVGVGAGLLGAVDPDGKATRLVKGISYVGFAIPTFIAADAMFFFAQEHLQVFGVQYDSEVGLYTIRNLQALLLPAIVLTVNVLAVQLRYARTESTEVLQEDFVRTLRASGAGTLTLVRHVLRNVASSLMALFVSELVGVVFVVLVVIEVIFGVPGFGTLLYDAIHERDIGLILGTTVLPIVLVMVGNLIQDVAHAIIDPRVEAE